MIASRVTPLTEEQGMEVDGAKGVGGAAEPDHLERSYTSLLLTVAALMAHITEKWSEMGKVIENGVKSS